MTKVSGKKQINSQSEKKKWILLSFMFLLGIKVVFKAGKLFPPYNLLHEFREAPLKFRSAIIDCVGTVVDETKSS